MNNKFLFICLVSFAFTPYVQAQEVLDFSGQVDVMLEGEGQELDKKISAGATEGPDSHKETPVPVNRIKKVLEYCSSSFQENQECPVDACAMRCSEQLVGRACVLECLPKDCINIPAARCPEDLCLILKGCNEQPICYPKESDEIPECGDMAYAGDDVECCEGFVKRCGIEFFDGTCDMVGSGSLDSVPICIPCGNGICNQFENRCNCPEDCENDTSMLDFLRAIKSRSNKENQEKP